VAVEFTTSGDYAGYDVTSPLTRDGGKATVLRELGLPRPILAVGDGATDLEMKPDVDRFVAFTGTIARERVVGSAHGSVRTFAELIADIQR
jgi:phosphoserine phosphatase